MNEKQNGIIKQELRAAKKFLETLHDSLVKVEKELSDMARQVNTVPAMNKDDNMLLQMQIETNLKIMAELLKMQKTTNEHIKNLQDMLN